VTEAQVAEATLRAYEAQVESNRKAISAAEAATAQAKAAVRSARINVGYTRITAPISGRIGKSNVTEGAIVTAYQPMPLATIQQLDPIYVDVPQATTELLRLKRRLEKGALRHNGAEERKVRLIMEDGTQYPLEGRLEFRDVSVDPTTGSVILRMVFPNPEGVLLPRMFVRAIIREGVKKDALLVGKNGKVERRMLKLGRAIGSRWLVISGLDPGDRVIVEGLQFVRPGMPVKATPFNPGKGPTRPQTLPQKRQGGGA